MKEIPLTRGKVALVDDEDYDRLAGHNWQAIHQHGRWHAQRIVGPRGDRHCVLMHREILQVGPGLQVDHINGDALDNRRANLRPCKPKQQQWNMHARRGKVPFKGVVQKNPKLNLRKPFSASIVVDAQQHHLGYFATAEEAARAYDAAAVKYFGEFAQLNFAETTNA